MPEFDANPQGSSFEEIAARISGNAEPQAPTAEDATIGEGGQDTSQDDTTVNANRFKAKLGDQDVEFDLITEGIDPSTIPKGLMMEADYRKKTSEVAEARKAIDSQVETLASALEQAKDLIELDIDALEADSELRDSDPDEYLRRLTDIQNRSKKYQEYQAKVSEHKQIKHQENIQLEQAKLKSAVPDWLDEDVMRSDFNKIAKVWTDSGYSPEEIASKTDHRDVVIARKAALYDEIMAQDLSQKETKSSGKTARPGVARTPADRADSRISEARNKLRKSGNVNDLAELFKLA